MDQATELLNQGIAAVRAGNRDEARQLLQAALRADPRNEQGWLWLSGVLEDPAQQRDCLQRVLALNPDNIAARRGLEQLAAREAASFMNTFSPSPPQAPVTPPQPAAQPPAPAPPQPAESQPAIPAPQPPGLPLAGPVPGIQPQVPGLPTQPTPGILPPEGISLESDTGIPTYATLPPPRVAPCFFCSTPDVAELCPACLQPQSYDCPRCGLPIDLRVNDTCRCGESLRPFLRPEGIDHERLGDRYLRDRYVAAAVKQWELAISTAKNPQALHRKIAEAYLDVGLVEKAREHLEASRHK